MQLRLADYTTDDFPTVQIAFDVGRNRGLLVGGLGGLVVGYLLAKLFKGGR